MKIIFVFKIQFKYTYNEIINNDVKQQKLRKSFFKIILCWTTFSLKKIGK